MRRFTLAAAERPPSPVLGTTLVAAPPATLVRRRSTGRSPPRRATAPRSPTAPSPTARGSAAAPSPPRPAPPAIRPSAAPTSPASTRPTTVAVRRARPASASPRASTPAPGPSAATASTRATRTHEIAKIVAGREQLRRAGHPGPELVLAGLPRQHRLPRRHQDRGRRASPSRPPTGRRRSWRLPTPGQPIVIPGLLEIRIGSEKTARPTPAGPRPRPTSSTCCSSRPTPRCGWPTPRPSSARGVKRGLFSGLSAATEVRALNDLVLRAARSR